MEIIKYEPKYRDDLIFMVLAAKDAIGRVPTLNADLLDIEGFYLDKGDMFWLAVDGGRVVGSIGCNLLPNGAAALHRLYVKPQFKRQGIGGALLKTAEDFAAENGRAVMKLHLGDAATYSESRAFYPKHGYIFLSEDQMQKKL